MIHITDIAWAAGFLEGEGSFQSCPANSQFTVNAVQIQREPLDRLLRLFSGHLKPYRNNHGTLYWRWAANGSYAVGIVLTLFPFMSPKRKAEIKAMVIGWKLRPGRTNKLKTHCRRGHEYTAENIYWTKGIGKRNPSRSCKECYRSYYPERKAERKEQVLQ